MTRPNEKIRPPTHSSLQPSDPKLRAEAEGDLPDLVRAPDPANRGAYIQHDEEPAPAEQAGELPPLMANFDPAQGAPGFDKVGPPPGALDPRDAARARREHDAPNRLGNPARPNQAAVLLANYQRTLREFKEDYQATRSMAKERPHLEAKQALIDAGLMKGDV
jgi:hypothetical protein